MPSCGLFKWMFCSWLKTRDCGFHSSFQGHLGTVSYTNQNAINTGVLSPQQNNLYSQEGSKYFNKNFIDKGKECFTMTYWAFWERHKTSKCRNTVKYMCTYPHLSLSLYIKHVFLTLKFYCITLLAENGKTPSQLSFSISSVHVTGNFGGVLFSKLSCLNAHH